MSNSNVSRSYRVGFKLTSAVLSAARVAGSAACSVVCSPVQVAREVSHGVVHAVRQNKMRTPDLVIHEPVVPAGFEPELYEHPVVLQTVVHNDVK